MRSQIYIREENVTELKEAFSLTKWFHPDPVPTALAGTVMLELPGIHVTTEGIVEASKRGLSFCGNVKSYDDERVFAAHQREYAIVRAHNQHPIASVNKAGEINPEEKVEIMKFWRLMEKVKES